MATRSNSPQSLAAIVSYLFTQRETILNKWRTVCQQDSRLTKISALSREEFNNLLPIILDILEQRLLGQELEADPAITAQAHGLHRWQKSFTLVDTMQELYHLTRIFFDELDLFHAFFPQTDAGLLLHVQRHISLTLQETVHGSVVKHDELQRLEAAQRASNLHLALEQMEELSRQRGNMLRTTSHDLHGSFGIINSAAYLLKMEGLSDTDRGQYLDMLNRNLTNVQSMLGNLMDLARLEAGGEVLHVQPVNVAQLLRDLVAGGQALATEQGLILRADGPDSLSVETDPTKLQRVVQNLLLNALRYTPTGFVSVSWSKENDARWIIAVQDSGPGLPHTLVGVFGNQLRPTVESTSVLAPEIGEPVAVLPTDVPQVPTGSELNQLARQSSKGEGIGLQIVKRLCELLSASLEIESREGRGTLFRIRLPIHHLA